MEIVTYHTYFFGLLTLTENIKKLCVKFYGKILNGSQEID